MSETPFSLEEVDYPFAHVIAVSGEIDVASAPRIRTAIAHAPACGMRAPGDRPVQGDVHRQRRPQRPVRRLAPDARGRPAGPRLLARGGPACRPRGRDGGGGAAVRLARGGARAVRARDRALGRWCRGARAVLAAACAARPARSRRRRLRGGVGRRCSAATHTVRVGSVRLGIPRVRLAGARCW